MNQNGLWGMLVSVRDAVLSRVSEEMRNSGCASSDIEKEKGDIRAIFTVIYDQARTNKRSNSKELPAEFERFDLWASQAGGWCGEPRQRVRNALIIFLGLPEKLQ